MRDRIILWPPFEMKGFAQPVIRKNPIRVKCGTDTRLSVQIDTLDAGV